MERTRCKLIVAALTMVVASLLPQVLHATGGRIFNVTSTLCYPGYGHTVEIPCYIPWKCSQTWYVYESATEGSCNTQACVVDLQNGSVAYCGEPYSYATCSYQETLYSCNWFNCGISPSTYPRNNGNCTYVTAY